MFLIQLNLKSNRVQMKRIRLFQNDLNSFLFKTTITDNGLPYQILSKSYIPKKKYEIVTSLFIDCHVITVFFSFAYVSRMLNRIQSKNEFFA